MISRLVDRLNHLDDRLIQRTPRRLAAYLGLAVGVLVLVIAALGPVSGEPGPGDAVGFVAGVVLLFIAVRALRHLPGPGSHPSGHEGR